MSEELAKVKGDEWYTYEDVLSIISEIHLNHVSTLYGGYWEYLIKRETLDLERL